MLNFGLRSSVIDRYFNVNISLIRIRNFVKLSPQQQKEKETEGERERVRAKVSIAYIFRQHQTQW